MLKFNIQLFAENTHIKQVKTPDNEVYKIDAYDAQTLTGKSASTAKPVSTSTDSEIPTSKAVYTGLAEKIDTSDYAVIDLGTTTPIPTLTSDQLTKITGAKFSVIKWNGKEYRLYATSNTYYNYSYKIVSTNEDLPDVTLVETTITQGRLNLNISTGVITNSNITETTYDKSAINSLLNNKQDALGNGTSGQVLAMNSSATSPEWHTPSTADLINDAGFITQDINVNTVGLQYTTCMSNTSLYGSQSWQSYVGAVSDRQRAGCYGNGYYVSTGANGSIMYSSNKIVWTKNSSSGMSGTLTGLTYGNGYFLCVSYENKKIYKAVDPTGVWTELVTLNYSLESIQYINNIFVASGENGLIVFSEKGDIWTPKTTNTQNAIYKVTYGNGKYVAVGASGTILYSINGDDWFTVTISGYTSDIRTVAYGAGIFILGGKDIKYSNDGINWNSSSLPATITGWIREFAYAEGRFYCGLYQSNGNGAIWTSTNFGSSFYSTYPLTGTSRVWYLTYGNGFFFASGDGGTVRALDLNLTWSNTIPYVPDNYYLWQRIVIIQNNGSFVCSDAFTNKLDYNNIGNIVYDNKENLLTGAQTFEDIIKIYEDNDRLFDNTSTDVDAYYGAYGIQLYNGDYGDEEYVNLKFPYNKAPGTYTIATTDDLPEVIDLRD